MNSEIRQLIDCFAQSVHPRRVAEQNREIEKYLLQSSDTLLEPNFSRISNSDLKLLFHIVDEVCLKGRLHRVYQSIAPEPLQFRLSKRMTSTGGMTTMKGLTRQPGLRLAEKSSFEIAIATTPIFQSFAQKERIKVSGVVCESRIEALQRIMEHEMIHLAEFLCWDDSNCKQLRFQNIVRHRFGHLEPTHQLHNHQTKARLEHGIRPGDLVRFDVGAQRLQGHVNRITKRATVLVPDRNGRLFNDGNHYSTYYVPVAKLRKVPG